jgi:hypothetical protein
MEILRPAVSQTNQPVEKVVVAPICAQKRSKTPKNQPKTLQTQGLKLLNGGQKTPQMSFSTGCNVFDTSSRSTAFVRLPGPVSRKT